MTPLPGGALALLEGRYDLRASAQLQRALDALKLRGGDPAALKIKPGLFDAPPDYTPLTPPRPPAAQDPKAREAQLRAQAQGDDPAEARVGLAGLEARGWGDAALYLELLHHKDRGRRLAALRGLKRVARREDYLDAALSCLEDERRPDVEAQLLRTLAYADYPPAAGALVGRLNHKRPKVREAAELGVRRLGEAALKALHRAARRARPDQRGLYLGLIEVLEGEG